MTWQQYVLMGTVALHLAGCASQRSDPVSTTSAAMSARTEPEPATLARLQKAEAEQPPAEIQKASLTSTTSPSIDAANSRLAVKIRAQVNGTAILDTEVREASYQRLRPNQTAAEQSEILKESLEGLIDREVVLQDLFSLEKKLPKFLEKLREAAGKEYDKRMRELKARNNIKTDEELKNAFRSQGLTMESFKRQITRDFMAREYMRSKIYPIIDRIGHQEILEYYQEHGNEFQNLDSVKWQDLFLDAGKFPTRPEARRFAEELATRARKGEEFTRLLQYDNGDGTYRQGEGFGHLRGEVRPPEAESRLFQMKDGEVAVVEITTGYHVIKLVKRDYAGQKPLDAKLQSEIRRKLQNQTLDRESKRLVAELRAKSSIEVVSETP